MNVYYSQHNLYFMNMLIQNSIYYAVFYIYMSVYKSVSIYASRSILSMYYTHSRVFAHA